MSGLGFTADIASFSEETVEKLKKMIDFWKETRPFVEKATLTSLTPKRPHSDRKSDIVWQLENSGEILISALHMENGCHGLKVVPKNIDENAEYRVDYVGAFRTNGFDKGYNIKGKELSENGILFAFPDSLTGRLAKITKL